MCQELGHIDITKASQQQDFLIVVRMVSLQVANSCDGALDSPHSIVCAYHQARDIVFCPFVGVNRVTSLHLLNLMLLNAAAAVVAALHLPLTIAQLQASLLLTQSVQTLHQLHRASLCIRRKPPS